MLHNTQREAVRVTPSTDQMKREQVRHQVAALHNLSAAEDEEGGLLSKVTSAGPLNLECLIMSAGEGEPIEVYYTGNNIPAIERQIDQLYPSSYDIEQTSLDLAEKLVTPVAFEPEDFLEHLQAGTLCSSVDALAVDTIDEDSDTATDSDAATGSTRSDAADAINGGITDGGSSEVDPTATGGSSQGPSPPSADTSEAEDSSGLTERARNLFSSGDTADEDDDEEATADDEPSSERGLNLDVDLSDIDLSTDENDSDSPDDESTFLDQVDSTQSPPSTNPESGKGGSSTNGTGGSADQWAPESHGESDQSDSGTAQTDADSSANTGDKRPQHLPKVGPGRRFAVDGTVIEVAPVSEYPTNDPLTSIDKPTLTPDGQILARPAEGLDPHIIRWFAREEKSKDWMTAAGSATDMPAEHNRQRRHQSRDAPFEPEPIVSAMEQLVDASHPTALQIVIEPHPDWEADADIRVENIKDGRDSPLAKGVGYEREATHASEEERIELIKAKSAKRSFYVNVRLVSVHTPSSIDEDLPAAAETHSDPTQITAEQDPFQAILAPIDGMYYSFKAQRCDRSSGLVSRTSEAETVFRRFQEGEVVRDPDSSLTKVSPFASTEPVLILSPRTLAELLVVPSADQFSGDLFRSARAEHRDRMPLHSPDPEALTQFREGATIGYPLTDRKQPMDQPIKLPERFLKQHFGLFASSGAGKSIKMINIMLSMHTEISGPEILFDKKGDRMCYEYLQAYYQRYGSLEDVYYFEVPEDIPVISFFDIRPALAGGRDRAEAVQDRIAYFHSIMELVMGEEEYNNAYLANQILSYLIKAKFDAKYGKDAFTIDELRQTATEMYEDRKVPKAAPRVEEALGRVLQKSEKQFDETMSAVLSRLDKLGEKDHIYAMLNQNPAWDEATNTYEGECLSFQELVEDDIQLLFDTGGLRTENQEAFTLILLSTLWNDLQWRRRLEEVDTQVNLIIEEAADVAASKLVSRQLIPQARSFGLSLGLVMQFPSQVKDRGGQRAYKELMHNVQNKIYGKLENPDDFLEQAIAVDEVNAEQVANKLKHMEPGQWVADLTTRHDDSVTTPFSIQALDIPAGHPESSSPLMRAERTRFESALDDRRGETKATFCVGDAETDSNQSGSSESPDSGSTGTAPPSTEDGSEGDTPERGDAEGDDTEGGDAESENFTGSSGFGFPPVGDKLDSDKDYAAKVIDDVDPSSSSDPGADDSEDDAPEGDASDVVDTCSCGAAIPAERDHCSRCADDSDSSAPSVESTTTTTGPADNSDDNSDEMDAGENDVGTTASDGASPDDSSPASDTSGQPNEGEGTPIPVESVELDSADDVGRLARAIGRSSVSEGERDSKLALLLSRAREHGMDYTFDDLRELAEESDSTDASASTEDEQPQSDQADQQIDPDSEVFEQLPKRSADVSNRDIERYDLTDDDLEFLSLLADAYHQDLEWYSLLDSMTSLRDEAGDPDIEHLEEIGFIEQADTRRVYYSLLPDGWEFINRTQYNVGDWNEKIKHRVGIVLGEEMLLGRNDVASVEPYYEAESGTVFDLAGFDSDGECVCVLEVECLNWNRDAMVEDYQKMAEIDATAYWLVDKRETGQRLFKALRNHQLAPDSLVFNVTSGQGELQDHISDMDLDGLHRIHTFPYVRDVIDR